MPLVEPWSFETEIFNRRLSPHRSLSVSHFRLLLAVFATICGLTTIPFFLLGAWPVIGFMGLDVAIFYLAFRANYRAALAYEQVSLTPLELQFARVSPHGRRLEWRFSPHWVRLEREEHWEFGTQRLALVSRGERVEVGHFLGPDAKADFADELTRALSMARRGPRFS